MPCWIFGDTRLKMPRVKYWFTIIGVFFGMFYGFGSRKYELGEAFGQSVSSGLVQLLISFGVIIGVIILFRLFSRLLLFGFLKRKSMYLLIHLYQEVLNF